MPVGAVPGQNLTAMLRPRHLPAGRPPLDAETAAATSALAGLARRALTLICKAVRDEKAILAIARARRLDLLTQADDRSHPLHS
jgi:hypothetical protein